MKKIYNLIRNSIMRMRWLHFRLIGMEMDKYPEIPFRHLLGPEYDHYKAHHVAMFASFDEFMKAASID